MFSTEGDGTDLREKPWGAYKKGVARWFFWESTYYNDNQTGSGQKDLFSEARTFGSSNPTPDPYYGLRGSNGDGVLFYPGTDAIFPASSYGISGPIASLRMKHWRRGIQDVDYLTLAKAINPSAVAALVQQMVPLAMWDLTVYDPSDPTYYYNVGPSWSDNPDVWEAARAQLAAIIDPIPAITAATATVACGPPASLTATFSGANLSAAEQYDVLVTIALTPNTGRTIVAKGRLTIPANTSGNFSVPVTVTGSLPSGVTFTLTGSATLRDRTANVKANTIPVSFTNSSNQVTCG